MIEIECEVPTKSHCECCGNTTVSLTRFVYRDGDAYAIYYAKFTAGHNEKRLSSIVSIGEWGEGSSPADRVAFPLEVWADEDNFQVGLVDAADSPWADVNLLGRVLDRAEALKHERLGEIFHITDHIVTDDKVVVDYFGTSARAKT